MQLKLEPRDCLNCKFKRIPYAKIVTKRNKHWVIFQCPMCKQQDIEMYFPKRLWTGKQFEEETLPESTTDEE